MTATSSEMPTAFILSRNEDAGQIARALRTVGYRVVDPVELDALEGKMREVEDAPDVVMRDLTRLMDCDMIVTGPKCELLPWAVAIAATAGTRKVPFELIERIVPTWRAA